MRCWLSLQAPHFHFRVALLCIVKGILIMSYNSGGRGRGGRGRGGRGGYQGGGGYSGVSNHGVEETKRLLNTVLTLLVRSLLLL